MKKFFIVFTVLLSILAFSCGDSGKNDMKQKDEKISAKKKKSDKITAEVYCNVYKDLDALMVEEYWPKLKGKDYKEVKDIFDEYMNKEKDVYEKHGIKNSLDLHDYYRGHFKEVEEYRKNDPGYKEYPEYSDARRTFTSFVMKRAMGE